MQLLRRWALRVFASEECKAYLHNLCIHDIHDISLLVLSSLMCREEALNAHVFMEECMVFNLSVHT